MKFPMPENESARLTSLYQYEILDTEKERVFDDITQLLSELTDCPIAYISFIDKERQWMKSTFALPDDFCEVPREVAFCNITICQTSINEIEDLTQHDILGQHDFVKGEPHFRYYCGAPLISSEGYALGTLCVLDFKVKRFELEQLEIIRKLAQQVVGQLERHKALKSIESMRESLHHQQQQIDQLLTNILPLDIATELKQTSAVATKLHDQCTLLYLDFVDFTQLTRTLQPADLISSLNEYFSQFDLLTSELKIEKIKTIGDAYLCASAIPKWQSQHALACCLLAKKIVKLLIANQHWPVRVSIHTGAVYAGVVGEKKFCYDLWGDTRETVEKMQQHTSSNQITISRFTQNLIDQYFHTQLVNGHDDLYELGELRDNYTLDELSLRVTMGG